MVLKNQFEVTDNYINWMKYLFHYFDKFNIVQNMYTEWSSHLFQNGGGGLVLQEHQEIGKVSHATSILRILLQYCTSKLEILNHVDLTCIGSMLLKAQVW